MNSQPVGSKPTSSAADERQPSPAAFVLRGGSVSCLVQHWSFQPRTAQLVLYHQHRLPAVADLQQWTERLREMGYTRVRTTALSGTSARLAETAGFLAIQELVLLEHVEPKMAGAPSTTTHRLLASQHDKASAIDVAAFSVTWALEPRAIGDVCAATPRHRARGAGTPLAAYAISGRDGRQGFLQRLAVAPQAQRQGLGRSLVLDSLRWLNRWRVQRVLVNTPADNEPALALYEHIGFRRLSDRLRVYERALP